jgi:cytidylate kinase
VRLTPASADGAAWRAQLLSARAKTLFNADEVVVAGTLAQWLINEAARADLRID